MLTASGPTDIQREHLTRVGESMAADGLRVLAFGVRRWPAWPAVVVFFAVEGEKWLKRNP